MIFWPVLFSFALTSNVFSATGSRMEKIRLSANHAAEKIENGTGWIIQEALSAWKKRKKLLKLRLGVFGKREEFCRGFWG